MAIRSSFEGRTARGGIFVRFVSTFKWRIRAFNFSNSAVQLDWSLRDVANAAINNDLKVLGRMFSLAVQAGKLAYKPHIPLLKENNARAGFFEAEQFESVRRHLPAHLRPVVTEHDEQKKAGQIEPRVFFPAARQARVTDGP